MIFFPDFIYIFDYFGKPLSNRDRIHAHTHIQHLPREGHVFVDTIDFHARRLRQRDSWWFRENEVPTVIVIYRSP